MASRACVLEEAAITETHERLLNTRAPPSTGLLLGKLEVGSRDVVLALVPTPAKEEDDDDAGGGPGPGRDASSSSAAAASASALEIDEDWIVEHATQATRMLPGGIHVVGVYVFASDVAMKRASSAALRAAIEVGLAERALDVYAPPPPASSSSSSSSSSVLTRHQASPERLVVHLSADARGKVVVKRCALADPGGDLRHVEHRLGKVAASLIRIDATYDVRCELELEREGGKTKTMRDAAGAAIEREATRVMASRVLLDGTFARPEEDVVGVVGADVRAAPVRAELLCPPRASSSSSAAAAASGGGRGGGVTLRGTITSRCYAYGRESIARACEDVKGDVVNSLRSRLGVLCDLADSADDAAAAAADEKEDSDAAAAAAHPLSEKGDPFPGGDWGPKRRASIALPRRAWARWTVGGEAEGDARHRGVQLCDYLTADEGAAEVVARAKEVLGCDVVGGVDGVEDDAEVSARDDDECEEEDDDEDEVDDAGYAPPDDGGPTFFGYLKGCHGYTVTADGKVVYDDRVACAWILFASACVALFTTIVNVFFTPDGTVKPGFEADMS